MATDVDLQEEVRAMTKHSRQEFLRDIGLPLEIPTDHCLAMKAGLSISWNKFRTLRRSAVYLVQLCTYMCTAYTYIEHTCTIGG